MHVPIRAGFRVEREQLASHNVDPQKTLVVWIPAGALAKSASRSMCVLNRACIAKRPGAGCRRWRPATPLETGTARHTNVCRNMYLQSPVGAALLPSAAPVDTTVMTVPSVCRTCVASDILLLHYGPGPLHVRVAPLLRGSAFGKQAQAWRLVRGRVRGAHRHL